MCKDVCLFKAATEFRQSNFDALVMVMVLVAGESIRLYNLWPFAWHTHVEHTDNSIYTKQKESSIWQNVRRDGFLSRLSLWKCSKLVYFYQFSKCIYVQHCWLCEYITAYALIFTATLYQFISVYTSLRSVLPMDTTRIKFILVEFLIYSHINWNKTKFSEPLTSTTSL